MSSETWQVARKYRLKNPLPNGQEGVTMYGEGPSPDHARADLEQRVHDLRQALDDEGHDE